jgi:hypothetical protein
MANTKRRSTHLLASTVTFTIFVLLSSTLWRQEINADVKGCRCQTLSASEIAATKECSLCVEADAQPTYLDVFVIPDEDTTKPHMFLALPRAHNFGLGADHPTHPMSDLSNTVRAELWAVAIAKAQPLWPNQWGLAYNGEETRQQCHLHIHIGKLQAGKTGPDEPTPFTIVDSPAESPVPQNDTGLWVSPVSGKLHVHLGETFAEGCWRNRLRELLCPCSCRSGFS